MALSASALAGVACRCCVHVPRRKRLASPPRSAVMSANTAAHSAHLASVVIPGAAAAAWAVRSDLRDWMRRHGSAQVAATVSFAATLAVVSAVIHALVVGPHWSQDPWVGAFFALASLGQLVWSAAIVLRPARWLAAAGSFGSAGLVLIWAVSRTTGLTVAGVATGREPVGWLDAATTLFEVGVVVACVVAARCLRDDQIPAYECSPTMKMFTT